MSNELDPEKLNQEIKELEEQRDTIINLSINLTRESKILIYSIISENFEKAKKTLEKMNELKKQLVELLDKYIIFYDNGKIGLQEYIEGVILYEFIVNKKVPSRDEFPEVALNEYLLGLMDFFGEALRYSVEQLSKDNIDIVEEIYDNLKKIYSDFLLRLEIKNYELRRKLDYVNGILRRFSEYILEYRIHKKE